MFSELGIETSRLYKTTYKQPNRKPSYYFYIDVVDYYRAGLGFVIQRKQKRLEWLITMLEAYRKEFPRYQVSRAA